MSDNGSDIELVINENFAKKYQEQKKLEDVLKIKEQFKGQEISDEKVEKILERKKKFGLDKEYDEEEGIKVFVDNESDTYLESSEEEEDEQGELLTKEIDSQIFKTLIKLKNKDEDIYDSKKNFFDQKLIKEAQEEAKKKKNIEKKDEAVTLGSLKREKLKKGEIIDEEEEEKEEVIMTHEQEQKKLKEDLKSAIKENFDESSDEEDFFSKRKKTEEEEKAEEEDYKNFLLEEMSKVDTSKKVYEQWASYKDNPNISKDDAFLMDYVLNRGWIDKNVGKIPTYDEIVGEMDSEEEIEKAEEFEKVYNFRNEEPGSSQIITYPRDITSVRTKTGRRKKQRERKKLLKAQEELRAQEEIKQKKNAKLEEILSTIKDLQKATGDSGISFEDLEKELDVDFDPDTYDKGFGDRFGNLYDKNNEDDDNEKPVFDDDIDIGDLEANQTPEEAQKIKEAAMKLMGEYYNMDYEDKIEDITTRFKYRKVDAFSGGLEVEDILYADDKELNKIYSMKEIAPYRNSDKALSVKKNKVYELRNKLVEEGALPKEVFKVLSKKAKSVKKSDESKDKKNKKDRKDKKEKKRKRESSKN